MSRKTWTLFRLGFSGRSDLVRTIDTLPFVFSTSVSNMSRTRIDPSKRGSLAPRSSIESPPQGMMTTL